MTRLARSSHSPRSPLASPRFAPVWLTPSSGFEASGTYLPRDSVRRRLTASRSGPREPGSRGLAARTAYDVRRPNPMLYWQPSCGRSRLGRLLTDRATTVRLAQPPTRSSPTLPPSMHAQSLRRSIPGSSQNLATPSISIETTWRALTAEPLLIVDKPAIRIPQAFFQPDC